MPDQTDGSETPVHCIVIAPNQSLSSLHLVELYGGGLLVSLAIATVLAWLGYWPILVFAVLEWLAIGGCVCVLLRAGRYREVVTITVDQVTVEKRDRERIASMSFQRHWASVERQGSSSWYPSRLLIRSRGTQCEIGRCLTEDERRALKVRLDELVGPVNQTPDLVG
ncbi:MAG TPA: DUF2244 domain-containing protein [Gammaproteobacteria bacterium]|nr:DUF2244 domain-containing protein [Gammaproteobacteria bacterium]